MYAKRLVFVAWFNAGVRAIDIRDPYNPREVGYYIPAKDRQDRQALRENARRRRALQSRDPDQQPRGRRRGYIYIVDRANTGMHILQVTGAAREIAKF